MNAKMLAMEAHARGCHCMPVRDEDGELVFTSRDDRCLRFSEELCAAFLARDAEMKEACAEEVEGSPYGESVHTIAARIRALPVGEP